MRYFLLSILLLFFSCTQNPTIKIKGSDTEVNLVVQLAETFHENDNRILVSISGGGSGLGIASLLNGTADIANSSRNISPKEIALFQQKGIALDSFVFAQDAIAFVVAESSPIDSISIKDLANVLKGEYTHWSALSTQNLPINIYGRQSNSGTYVYIKHKLSIEFSPHAKQMNGNAQILEAIKADNSGIGYVGVGYVTHGGSKGIKVLSIYKDKNEKAVSPLNAEMIAAGKYFFQRPLFQYYKAADYQTIKPFLAFEKTEKGKQIIQSAGYFPIQAL